VLASEAPDLAPFPNFVPRAPWWSGDLQTIRNYFLGKPDDLSGFPATRFELPLGDGTGDRIAAVLNRPVMARRLPLAVLIHGLTGDEDSVYILRTAGHLLRNGYPVLRLNLRGAGRSSPLCRFQYHAGRTEDLRAVLAGLPAAELAHGALLIGYSLGANLVLKLLGEGAPDLIRAGVAVSAPIDLAAAARQFRRWRNIAYQRHVLARMKAEALRPTAALTPAERRSIRRARSVVAFDKCFTAPRNGFAGPSDYYARNSALGFLDRIDRRTLVIHALDDPWIPAAAYLAYDWSRNPHLMPLLPRRGGHVGFTGKDRRMAWHDQCILRFLAELPPR
jgi:uncharacterized protein